jgi:hypothetical protein
MNNFFTSDVNAPMLDLPSPIKDRTISEDYSTQYTLTHTLPAYEEAYSECISSPCMPKSSFPNTEMSYLSQNLNNDKMQQNMLCNLSKAYCLCNLNVFDKMHRNSTQKVPTSSFSSHYEQYKSLEDLKTKLSEEGKILTKEEMYYILLKPFKYTKTLAYDAVANKTQVLYF